MYDPVTIEINRRAVQLFRWPGMIRRHKMMRLKMGCGGLGSNQTRLLT